MFICTHHQLGRPGLPYRGKIQLEPTESWQWMVRACSLVEGRLVRAVSPAKLVEVMGPSAQNESPESRLFETLNGFPGGCDLRTVHPL